MPPPGPPPTPTRTRRIAHEQRVRRVTRQISALRGEGKTWAEVAAATGLVSSRVRAIHARRVSVPTNTSDDAILANVRAFLTTQSGRSRRAYAIEHGRSHRPRLKTASARGHTRSAWRHAYQKERTDEQRALHGNSHHECRSSSSASKHVES